MSEPISTVEQLVAAREARGLSPEDVLRQLKLAPRQLRAIESADWQALPGAAFTRAVLRSYGRVLDADVGPLLASLSPSVQSTELKPSSSLDTPLPARSMLGFGSGGGGSRLAWLALALLAVIALALFFGGGADLSNVRSWLSELRGSETPAGQVAEGEQAVDAKAPGVTVVPVPLGSSVQSPAQGPGTPVPAQGAVPTPPGAGVTQPPASAGSSVAPSTPPAAATSAPPSPAPSAALSTASPSAEAAGAPAGAQASVAVPAAADADRRHTLKLRFERESWIEVRGADGSVLVTGTQQGQSSREISGAGPLSLIIGNAEHVRAELDGKPFDLAPHTRATIARVRIP